MKVVERIDAMSLGKIFAGIYALFGLVTGVFVSLFGSIATGAGASIAGLGLLAVVVLPLLYGLLGFIGGIITAWIYNLIAKKFGGIKIELK